MRTSKIQEFIDFYNSTNFYVAEHFASCSPKMLENYLTKNKGKIEDILIIRKKKNGKNNKTS